MRKLLGAVVVIVVAAVAAAPASAAKPTTAPGKPGKSAYPWAPANKDGFGTSTTASSHVWFTTGQSQLTEVFYPDLGTPSVRGLELVVTDGRRFTDRESLDTRGASRLLDPTSLTYRQTNIALSGAYRITKTYVTDPRRDTVLIDVDVRSTGGRPYKVYVLFDPSLTNNGNDDSGRAAQRALLVHDGSMGAALRATPRLRSTTTGYLGRSDLWTDLRGDHELDDRYDRSARGNSVLGALTAATGAKGHHHITLALGFGRNTASANRKAAASLHDGFRKIRKSYAAGWKDYLASLNKPPPSLTFDDERAEYQASLMVLRASEDKRNRGAIVASPTMPWAFGDGSIDKPSGAYHLVWSRDLYEIATAQLAAGDRASALRALDFLLERQQKRDGSFPQNSDVKGKPHWTKTQMDEVAFPIVLAWQLNRTDSSIWASLKRAADFIVKTGPKSEQERWENQEGWSPATIAAEIAGLVCAADIAKKNGATTDAARYLSTADSWRASLDSWTLTSNGPLSSKPYFLRITKKADPNVGATYKIGDGGPSKKDQREVVDPSFLELVRLGIRSASDPAIVNTLAVVDGTLKVRTDNGDFWRRFTDDGYGETKSGGPWRIGKDDTFTTLGRAWPILAGERGEYELAAGHSARTQLQAMVESANDGLLIPEQVWDGRPPTGRTGFKAGEGTTSATPLAWSHAQFVRLAWSMTVGAPVELPAVVACRYIGCPPGSYPGQYPYRSFMTIRAPRSSQSGSSSGVSCAECAPARNMRSPEGDHAPGDSTPR